LHRIIVGISESTCPEDGISFDTSKLVLRRTQTTGEYDGVGCSFSARLFTSKIPMRIDIGFNDKVIPHPKKISYPTLLEMPKPILFGYTMETSFAEKLESIVKLASVNTRLKDFYDLWNMINKHNMHPKKLRQAIDEVFSNRGTPLGYPTAFETEFCKHPDTEKRWDNFLKMIGNQPIPFDEVVSDLSTFVKTVLEI
jgi:hypothetical protein